QPGPVQVHAELVLPGPIADRLDLFDGIDPAAAAIVRVFQAHQPRDDAVLIDRPDLVFELRDIEDAVFALDRAAGDAAQDRRSSRFVVVDMASQVAEDLIARLRMRPETDLIRHGARGHEQGGLLAEQRGDALLQTDNGRVLAEDVVADDRRRHRRAHASRRLGYRVAAQIDVRLRHLFATSSLTE